MADQATNLDWANSWLDMQRRYWDNWVRMTQSLASPPKAQASFPASPTDAISQSLDFWSKMLSPTLPNQSRDMVQKMFSLNKGYLQFGESLWQSITAAQTATKSAEGWWDNFVQSIQQMQQEFAGKVGAGSDPWAGFATFWGMPLDNWRRVISACSVLPGDMERALRGGGAPYDVIHGAVSGVLSTPALGYTREWQEQVQVWTQLWLNHGRSIQDYGMVLAKISARAIELFTGKAAELATKGETIDSLRAIYNLWVDCGEEAYGEFSMGEEFSLAQAQLTNTLMAVKRHEQQMMDEVLAGLNMPTRRELDSNHRRVHELERRIWRLQEALEALSAGEATELPQPSPAPAGTPSPRTRKKVAVRPAATSTTPEA